MHPGFIDVLRQKKAVLLSSTAVATCVESSMTFLMSGRYRYRFAVAQRPKDKRGGAGIARTLANSLMP
jgi:hypothetical protein